MKKYRSFVVASPTSIVDFSTWFNFFPLGDSDSFEEEESKILEIDPTGLRNPLQFVILNKDNYIVGLWSPSNTRLYRLIPATERFEQRASSFSKLIKVQCGDMERIAYKDPVSNLVLRKDLSSEFHKYHPLFPSIYMYDRPPEREYTEDEKVVRRKLEEELDFEYCRINNLH